MKKIFLFLFLPSVCFGAGTVSINQGSGTGTVTITGGSGGGGSGTITGVTAGNGLTGGGNSGNVTLTVDPSTVTLSGQLIAGSNITLTPGAGQTTISSTGGGATLPLPPGDTNYIQNQATSVQQATFSVVLGTVAILNVANGGNGASLNVGGVMTIDRPDITCGAFSSRGSLIFNPNSAAPFLKIKDCFGSSTTQGLEFDDSSGNPFFYLQGGQSSPGNVGMYLSSGTVGSSPTGRWSVSGTNGTQTFTDPNNNVMASISPSTFTISSTYINLGGTNYRWNAGVGSAGQCLQTDGASPIPTLTWGSCSGGSTSFVLLEDGTDFLLEDGTKLITE